MIQTSIIFFFFAGLFLLLPGWLAIRWAGVRAGKVTSMFLSTVVGICLFLLAETAVRLLELPQAIMYVYVLGLAMFQRKTLYDGIHIAFRTFRAPSKSILFQLGIVGVLVFMLSAVHLDSALPGDTLSFSATRDSLWRVSIIQEIKNHFPPAVPGYPAEALKNYHFFYDFLIASFAMLSGLGVFDLYFRFFTLLSALLFVGGVYAVITLWTRSRVVVLFGTVLTILTGNVSYLLPFFSSQYTFFARSNIFMADSPFDQSHNPFNLMAYGMLLAIIVLFYYWEKKPSWRTFLLLSIVLGVLPLIKVYAGMVAVAGVIGGLLFVMLTARKFYWYSFFPAVIVLPLLSLIRGGSFSILTWNPGWILVKMIQDHDRLFWQDMVLRQQHYVQTKNIVRLVYLYGVQLLVYFIGNLNVRIFALGIVLTPMRSALQKSATFAAIVTSILFAFGIPLFFSQTRGVYDSIQLTPYGLILVGIVLIWTFESGIVAWGKSMVTAVCASTLLLTAVPTTASVFYTWVTDTKEAISAQEVRAADQLQEISTPDDIILTDLAPQKMNILLLPALAGRRVYLGGTSLVEQTGITTSGRLKQVNDFFAYDSIVDTKEDLEQKRAFLLAEHISYIYLSNEGLRSKQLMEALELPLVYESETVNIYKVL